MLGSFHAVIDAILADDETAPPKQRHTAMQLFRRLRDEYGYPGGYDQVRRYVGQHRRDHRETFIPLAHDPGQRLECDFGHIHVDFPDGRRLVPVLIAAWAYSNYAFALAMPTERTEAILAGMVAALRVLRLRAPRGLVGQPQDRGQRRSSRAASAGPTSYYAALASHYAFEPLFCMPARGNEKPRAETRVRVLQRQWATPVPRCADLDALNAYLRARCVEEVSRTVAGYTESIGQRFACDQAKALPLPAHRFDACVTQPAQVDKYQTVRFDSNRYSVPRTCAFQSVTVKGYIDRVEVVGAWPGGGTARTQLRPRPAGARPAALPGDAGAPAGGAGPRAGAARLALARSRSRGCGRLWKRGTGRRPGRATTSASCSCWPSTPGACPAAPWRPACAAARCRPNASAPRRRRLTAVAGQRRPQ